VITTAARFAIALFIALSVRAAVAQQPGSYPSPQYPRANYQTLPPFQFQGQAAPSQQPQAPQTQPQQPGANQSLRYPLPNVPAGGPQPPAQQAPPQQPPAPVINAPVNNPTAPPFSAAPVTPATSISPLNPPIAPQPVLFAPGQIVARVGDKSILYCDVAPTVNMIMAAALAKASSDAERRQLEMQREVLTKNVVMGAVQTKLLYIEFERSIPPEIRSDPKKRSEMDGKQRKIISKVFDESLAAAREKVATASSEEIDSLLRQDGTIVRLALLMKERHLESHGELDAALRAFGSSLQQQVKDYGEYMMGMEAARSAIVNGGKKPDPKTEGKPKPKEITHQEMLDYYELHIADYYIPAKARFELLTARFTNFRGDRNKTWDAIVKMGN